MTSSPSNTASDTASRKPALVSVITVVFNDVKYLARTIHSVLEQTLPDIEYIVIDGDSSDGTREVVADHAARISIVVSEPDRGVYDAMNKGIARASGEYLLFMNSGDVFASPDALSLAMRSATSGIEEVIFGCWIRDEGAGRRRRCAPSLEAGLFNHQAIVYSRSIHHWHGLYVNVRGLTTADYLFFATLIAAGTVPCRTVDTPIATIDVNGISAGLQTFSQKHAIDFLIGRTSRQWLITVLALHPLYSRAKRMLRGLR